MDLNVALAYGQGAYYVATGLWPIFNMRTFMSVTGPKTDKWLVQMVGLLAASIGIPLLAAAAQGSVNLQLAWVAMLAATSFLAISVYYTARGVIGKVYLLDAVLELALLVGWAVALAQG